MKRFLKKIVASMAAVGICLSLTANCFAAELPHAFWVPDNAYLAALNSGDDSGIITFGQQALEVIRPLANTEQKANIMASRLDQIGLAYERRGQYADARNCYQEYIPYAQQLNWEDGVRIANAKVLHYTPELDLYTKSYDSQVNFHAKNEHESGVRYGVPIDGGTQSLIPNASVQLVYLEFGDPSLLHVEQALQAAAAKGASVELAWNIPGEGADMWKIPQSGEHISAVTALLSQYSSVPVYVRFGAEMNVWTAQADPGEFISAFQMVANTVKNSCPNAAMIWSVGFASSWDTNMNDYYPGDEYVDWVGVSLYLQKYFLGQTWSEEESFNELVFYAGRGADPILAMKEVMDNYGWRKPIMIAESGVSHEIRTLGENATDWASLRLRQMLYNIPMVYPQVKVMAYFDKVMTNEYNNYALESNGTLQQQYATAVQDETFLQTGTNLTPASWHKESGWFEVTGNTLVTRAHVHTFGVEEPTLNYFIDGNWAGQQTKIPYEATLDISGLSAGNHTLRVVAADAYGTELAAQEYTISKLPEIKITVNGKPVETDVPPMLQNDRTLVPIRAVGNALQAEIDWNENSKTVTVKKADTTLTLQIANKTMSSNQGNSALDVPPQQIDNRTLVPLRAVSSGLGAVVNWNGETNTVEITQAN